MRFSEFQSFPREAKNLIIYYTISSPLLITWTVFPIYLFMLRFNVENVGILYTVSSFFAALATAVIGRLLDKRITARNAIILLECFGMVSNFVFSKAETASDIILGETIERAGLTFSVAFQVYEKDAYPEDIREKVYAYHMALPHIATIISYLIIGILLTYVFTSIVAYRFLYFVAGLFSILIVLYVYKFLPNISNKISFKEKSKKAKIPRRLLPIAIGEILIVLGFIFAPEFILANYIYNILGFSVLYFVLLSVISGIISVIASEIASRGSKKLRFAMIYGGIFLMIVYSFAIYMLQYLTITPIAKLLIIFAVTIILEFGHTFYFIYERAYLLDNIPNEIRGTILGLISSTTRIVAIIAPAIAGIIAYRIGALTPFLAQTFFLSSGIIAFWISSKIMD